MIIIQAMRAPRILQKVARHSSESFAAPVKSNATSNNPKHNVSNMSMLGNLSTDIPNLILNMHQTSYLKTGYADHVIKNSFT